MNTSQGLLIGAVMIAALSAKDAVARVYHPVGVASYYGWHEHGRTMANGHRFDALGMTAASRTLKLGTPVRVINLANHRSVRLVVTDRGPYVGGRILDVSLGAARRLNMVDAGLARVRVEVVRASKHRITRAWTHRACRRITTG